MIFGLPDRAKVSSLDLFIFTGWLVKGAHLDSCSKLGTHKGSH